MAGQQPLDSEALDPFQPFEDDPFHGIVAQKKSPWVAVGALRELARLAGGAACLAGAVLSRS